MMSNVSPINGCCRVCMLYDVARIQRSVSHVSGRGLQAARSNCRVSGFGLLISDFGFGLWAAYSKCQMSSCVLLQLAAGFGLQVSQAQGSGFQASSIRAFMFQAFMLHASGFQVTGLKLQACCLQPAASGLQASIINIYVSRFPLPAVLKTILLTCIINEEPRPTVIVSARLG